MATKAEWLSKPTRQLITAYPGGQGKLRDLVLKMLQGGKAFVKDDKLSYEFLMVNMRTLFAGSAYAKFVLAFKAVLTNAWTGGEKVFFDLELLRKLDIALSLYTCGDRLRLIFKMTDASLLPGVDQHLR